MASARSGRTTRRQVARDHADIALRRKGALVATALRTRSVHAREVLAELAWPGHDLEQVVAAVEDGIPLEELSGASPEWLAQLGLVLAVQTGDSREQHQARSLLQAVQREAAEEMTGRTVEMLAQLHLAARDATAVEAVLADPRPRRAVRRALVSDLHNPYLFPGRDEQEWLRSLNETLHGPRVADLRIGPARPGRSAPFDRLEVPGAADVAAPLRVSVIMSAYQPGAALRTAVGSVLAQTWGNLELLIVDDASGPEYADVFAEVSRLDPRVRVIHKAVNGGTYRARNTALRVAEGWAFTTVDSDDWLHPQAVQLGMEPLLSQPALMATRSEGVRVSEDLELNRPGYAPRFVAAPSLMVRAQPALARVGFFDPTRKAADTEYALRLQAAFGTRSLRDREEVLLLLRSGHTLSSAEFARGWRHPARHAYKSAYTGWHRRIASARAESFLDPDGPRLFPEPRRWKRPTSAALRRPPRFDVCLAGDWRAYGGPQRSMMEEIEASRQAGLRVAVMHLEALRFMTSRDLPLCEPLQQLLAEGEVQLVSVDDDVDIDVLMVRYPPILQYPPAVPTRVRAGQVLVMANQAPAEPDGSDQRYVVEDVTARTAELFGSDPLWVPQSSRIRRLLREEDPQVLMVPWDNPGLIDTDGWRVRSARVAGRDGRPVVVGRYSRDNAAKFPPDLQQLLLAYDLGPGYEVRMMGATARVRELFAQAGRDPSEMPASWHVLPQGAQDPRDFLRGLDAFVYMDNPWMHESFGRTLLEAAASGVLTVAHPKHREVFGDALVYAEPAEVREVLRHYVADSEAYDARVEQSLHEVRRRFDRAQFVSHIRRTAGQPSGAAGEAESLSDLGAGGSLRVGPWRAAGSSPLEVTARPWAVTSALLRRAADAGGADQVSVVHPPEAGQRVREWLSATYDAVPDAGVPQALLDAPTSEAVAVAVCLDGLFHLSSRLPPDGDPTQDQHALTGLRPPPGWFTRTWWAGRQPRTIGLGGASQR